MSEVTVVANVACLGLERGQTATVELTPMIQGALDGGKLSVVEPEPVVDTVSPGATRKRG